MGTLRSTHECLPMDRIPSVRCAKHHMVGTNADQTRQQCCIHTRRQLHYVQQCCTRQHLQEQWQLFPQTIPTSTISRGHRKRWWLPRRSRMWTNHSSDFLQFNEGTHAIGTSRLLGNERSRRIAHTSTQETTIIILQSEDNATTRLSLQHRRLGRCTNHQVHPQRRVQRTHRRNTRMERRAQYQTNELWTTLDRFDSVQTTTRCTEGSSNH